MRYNTLLFDLDGTLLDFDATQDIALQAVFAAYQIPCSEALLGTYLSVNNELWAQHDRGELTLDQLFQARFTRTLARHGIPGDGVAMEAEYRRLLGELAQPKEGAAALCQSLYGRHRLYVVTNGVRHTQLAKLTGIGLLSFFEEVFDSHSVGARKPEPAFFDYVKSHIPGFDPASTLLIGDSLTTDIAGGTAAGLDTCWLTTPRHDEVSPATYVIHALPELLPILEAQ